MKSLIRTSGWRSLFCALIAAACRLPGTGVAAPVATHSLHLIPWPRSAELVAGRLNLGNKSRILTATDNLAPLAKRLSDEIQLAGRMLLPTGSGNSRPADVLLTLDPALNGEAYTVPVKDYAIVSDANYHSAASGTATLLQMLTAADGALTLPRRNLADEPAYPYRGLLIDLARKYHTPGAIKQVIERCRLYKIRYLHLHSSDDQLFMFPSTDFPAASSTFSMMKLLPRIRKSRRKPSFVKATSCQTLTHGLRRRVPRPTIWRSSCSSHDRLVRYPSSFVLRGMTRGQHTPRRDSHGAGCYTLAWQRKADEHEQANSGYRRPDSEGHPLALRSLWAGPPFFMRQWLPTGQASIIRRHGSQSHQHRPRPPPVAHG